MHVVPFVPRHAAGVVDVILPIQQVEFGVPITLDDQPDLRDIPGFYQRDGGNFWVALVGARVIGTIALLDIGGGRGALRKMFVARDHRGAASGVARRLLDVLVAWCRARDIREVYLGTTEHFRAAHRFYEKHGFVEVARAALPATFPVMTVDTKFYRRRLAPAA